MTLSGLVKSFRRELYLPDPNQLYMALSVYVANRLKGSPVWVMMVGPSSAGGTMLLNCMSHLPKTILVTDSTKAGLLSGATKPKKAQTTDGVKQQTILERMNPFGLLLWQDFTTVLDMNETARAEFLGALRTVYDGNVDRTTGVDGGLRRRWTGKAGFLGKCTGALDSALGVSNEMGTRTLYWRMPKLPMNQSTTKVRRALGHIHRFEGGLSDSVKEYWDETLAPVIEETEHEVNQREEDFSIYAGLLIARGRSPVKRDIRTRAVLDYEEEEAPRAAKQLANILMSLRLMGVEPQIKRQIATKLALDSLPKLRGAVLRAVIRLGPGQHSFRHIVNSMPDMSMVSETVLREAFHDLRIHNLLACEGDKGMKWELSSEGVDILHRLGVIE